MDGGSNASASGTSRDKPPAVVCPQFCLMRRVCMEECPMIFMREEDQWQTDLKS